jgi:hypothetical protein
VPASPTAPTRAGSGVSPSDIEAWLGELGIEPGERQQRDALAAWDVILDGRRRSGVRATIIFDPSVGCVVWVHYAPPLTDQVRRTYRRLLHWNDALPFAKFALTDDERPVLESEIPRRWLDRDELGLAIARSLAICDLLLDESAAMIRAAKPAPEPGAAPRNSKLLERYADQLAELAVG